MSRNRIVYIVLFVALLLIVLLFVLSKYSNNDNSEPMNLDITTEDDRIMQGLWYEGNGDLNNSYMVFDKLYKDTKSNAYLLEDIRLSLLTGTRLKQSKVELDKLRKQYPNDTKILRLVMTLHLVQKDFAKAKNEAEALIKISNDKLDISIASDALIYAGEPNRALEVLNKLYNGEHDEEIAMRMSTILYDMYSEPQQAASLLQEHYDKYGGGDDLKDKLYEIYISSKSFDSANKFAIAIYNDTMDYKYINDLAMKYYDNKQCSKASLLMGTIKQKETIYNQDIQKNIEKINSCIKAKIGS